MIALVVVLGLAVAGLAVALLRTRGALARSDAETARARSELGATESARATQAHLREEAEQARDEALERVQRAKRDAAEVANRAREQAAELATLEADHQAVTVALRRVEAELAEAVAAPPAEPERVGSVPGDAIAADPIAADAIAADPLAAQARHGDPSSAEPAPAADLVWALTMARLDRAWRVSVATDPTTRSPLSEEATARAAAGILVDAAREEAGAMLELSWSGDADLDEATAAATIAIVEELVAQATKLAAEARLTVAVDDDAVTIGIDGHDDAGLPVLVPAPSGVSDPEGRWRLPRGARLEASEP